MAALTKIQTLTLLLTGATVGCSEGALDPSDVFERVSETESGSDAGNLQPAASDLVAEPQPLDPVTFECSASSDACPLSHGLAYACKQRFALGFNYAWRTFAGDFGGAFGEAGVSSNRASYNLDLKRMRDNGVSVVRWWMFPDFRGNGVVFDGATPLGLSEQAVSDVHAALELAEQNDVYLVLTPFSFDNFRADRVEGNRTVYGLTAMVKDPERRAQLVDAVVGGAARAVASSEYAHRLLGWDVINEPEWAIAPSDDAPPGLDFTPNDDFLWVSVEEMKALISESLAVLKQETPHALTSVGWAAAKWAWAFSDLDNIDFHQPHIYTWVNQHWPYTLTPAELGYGDKPTVMGEFFFAEMPLQGQEGRPGSDNASFATIVNKWWSNGYAGAWAWSLSDSEAPLSLLNDVAEQRGCSASF